MRDFYSTLTGLTIAAFALSGCAQIHNTYHITGDGNKVIASDNVNKSTKDLLDMAGSAYGDAETKQGDRR